MFAKLKKGSDFVYVNPATVAYTEAGRDGQTTIYFAVASAPQDQRFIQTSGLVLLQVDEPIAEVKRKLGNVGR